MKRLALVTDGTAESYALARWLRDRGVSADLIEEKNPGEADSTAAIRRQGGARVIVLSTRSRASDVSAEAAVAWTRAQLGALPEMERRISGPTVLDAQRSEGDSALDALLLALAGKPIISGRRGRPPGMDPVRGVGFDVIVAMLCQPDRDWTERALADAIERAPSAVHKAWAELSRRGYLRRRRGATLVRDSVVLRDDLVRAWRGVVGSPRRAIGLEPPGRRDVRGVLRGLRGTDIHWMLAGAAAVVGQETVVEPGVVIYANDHAVAALRTLGCRDSAPAAARLRVWEPSEPGVFYRGRSIEGLPATNRVITFIDLSVADIDRYSSVAEALWNCET
jgi:hypothetical protein